MIKKQIVRLNKAWLLDVNICFWKSSIQSKSSCLIEMGLKCQDKSSQVLDCLYLGNLVIDVKVLEKSLYCKTEDSGLEKKELMREIV